MASIFTTGSRYSEWDGTHDLSGLDAEEVLNALTDDLMNFGDLQHALRNLMQRGMNTPQGDGMQGLRDLLQKLRQQRRERLADVDILTARTRHHGGELSVGQGCGDRQNAGNGPRDQEPARTSQ